jgi:2'-5' RNA ligase
VPERRAFHPHLTLARWNGAEPAAIIPWLERHARLSGPSWRVDRLTLFESRLNKAGANYEAVLEVPARNDGQGLPEGA